MWKNRKNAHQLSSDSFAETLLVMSSKGSGDGDVGGKVLGAEQSQARAHRGSGEEGKAEQHRAGVCGKLQRVRQFAHVDGNWPTFVCLKCESMMNATWCCAEPDLQGVLSLSVNPFKPIHVCVCLCVCLCVCVCVCLFVFCSGECER